MSNRRNGEFFLPNQVSDTNTVDALNDAVNTLADVCGGKYEPDYLYAGNFRVGEGGVEVSDGEGLFLTPSNAWQKFKDQISLKGGITFLGASVGRGANASDEKTRSFRRLLQESINKNNQIRNYGYIRSYVTSATINFISNTDWNQQPSKTDFGGGKMTSISASASYVGNASYRYCSITYEAGVAGTITVSDAGGVIGTIDASIGSGRIESPVFDSGAISTQNITISCNASGVVVYGFSLWEDTDLPSLDAYVCAGKAMSDISDQIIDDYVDFGKPIINLVMSNDNDSQVLYDKSNRLVQRAKAEGLIVVLINTIINPLYKPDNVFAYKQLSSENENVIYMDITDFIPASHMDDDVHPNDMGHNDYASYICGKLGMSLVSYSEMP